MKHLLSTYILLSLAAVAVAQKQIYIPAEHQAGINDCNSDYCLGRSYQTDNFLFLWKTGVNPNYSSMDACEPIFDFYVDELAFASTDPSANIHQLKIVVMIDPGIVGVAYGSGVDGVIGAMWVGPGTLAGSVFAHELGHTFSYQAGVDGPYQYGFQDQPGENGSRIYTGPFWETTANYMAYQYPGFSGGANGNLGMYMRTYNYFFTHARSRYEAWPMLEALQSELGTGYLGQVWLQSMDPEHPVETVKRVFANNNQSQANDLFAKAAMRLINWDIREPLSTQLKNYVNNNYNPYHPLFFQTLLRPIDVELGRYAVSDNFAPQEYGFNAIKLFPERDNGGNATVYVHFRGIHTNNNAGWRYGFVTRSNSGQISYSPIYGEDQQIISTEISSDDLELYLVVVGAPDTHTNYGWEIGFPRVYRYPYELALKNAVPEGYEANFRRPSGVSGTTHANGGGFVANTASVSSSVFVGVNAQVLGNATVSGNARIEDWAVITDNANVSGSAVIRGHALVGGTANVYGSAIVSDEVRISGSTNVYDNAQVLDGANITSSTVSGNAVVKGNAFEWGQTISGTAVVGGDNQNTTASSGVYLQKPDDNNGRVAGDGLGANHESNIDINTIPITYATDEEMAIPVGNLPPVAAFDASQTIVSPGASVSFVDLSSNDPDSWLWDFGDGSTSTVQNPSHAYQNVGTYTVSLHVSNEIGSDSEIKNGWILVSNQINIAPQATPSTSFVSSWETLAAVNDGIQPAHSGDNANGAYGNWDGEANYNTYNYVEYTWTSEQNLVSTQIYWWDDGGGIDQPSDANIEYWNGSTWLSIGAIGTDLDAFNALELNVTTTGLRVNMVSASATGILEWEVYGGTNSTPDNEPPSVPGIPIADVIGTNTVTLSWDASTDNTSVTGYRVFEGGNEIQVVADPSVVVTGLSPDTQYAFSVSAFDAASNESGTSGTLNLTTGSAPTDNNIAPLATASTSFVSSWETVAALNDESSPVNSND